MKSQTKEVADDGFHGSIIVDYIIDIRGESNTSVMNLESHGMSVLTGHLRTHIVEVRTHVSI